MLGRKINAHRIDGTGHFVERSEHRYAFNGLELRIDRQNGVAFFFKKRDGLVGITFGIV